MGKVKESKAAILRHEAERAAEQVTYSVLILSNHDYGPDEVILFPATDDHDKDAEDLYRFAKSKGYREEYEDYWIFTGQHVSGPSLLMDRSCKGTFAA